MKEKEVAEAVQSENSELYNGCATEEFVGDIDKVMALLAEKNCEVESQKCKIAELDDRYKRLQADFENFRRRTRQEKEELTNYVTQSVVKEVLPVLDNFERALAMAKGQDMAALLSGVEMICRQLYSSLEKTGLEIVPALGNQFDPNQHEAVMRVEDASQPDGMIIEELQKGYAVRGKVIRPSMVKVVGN